MSQPVPMVQCGGVGVEKGWITLLLYRLPQAQHTYQEGLISTAVNSGSTGEYGRHCTLFHYGFQKQILASKDGAQVSAIHRFHHGKPGVLRVHSYALWAMQCSHDFSVPHAEHLGGLNLTYCIIYLDDIIVFGFTEEEHLECLCIMFERFCEFNLKLKPSKC